jgi:hypothetical protein
MIQVSAIPTSEPVDLRLHAFAARKFFGRRNWRVARFGAGALLRHDAVVGQLQAKPFELLDLVDNGLIPPHAADQTPGAKRAQALHQWT